MVFVPFVKLGFGRWDRHRRGWYGYQKSFQVPVAPGRKDLVQVGRPRAAVLVLFLAIAKSMGVRSLFGVVLPLCAPCPCNEDFDMR